VAWGSPGIASGSNDKQVRIWDAGLTHLVSTLSRDEAGVPAETRAYKGGAYSAPAHDGEVTTVAWRQDGSLLASGASDYTIRIWDPRTWTATLTLTGHQAAVNSVAWSPDGALLVSGADDATVRLWRIAEPPPS
jgi:WD40 repeat protein